MVRCLVALNRGDLGRPPWFTLLTWVFRRDFIKRDHLGFGFGCISRRERGQRLSLLPTPRHVRISSRCHSELRESRFLISCLLNHRLPDRAAKITSLFNEESLMVFFFFFHPENKHIRFFAAATFFRDCCGYCYTLLCMVPGAELGKSCLVEFSQTLCKSWFLEEEIWCREDRGTTQGHTAVRSSSALGWAHDCILHDDLSSVMCSVYPLACG